MSPTASPAYTQNSQGPISQAAALLARHQFHSLERWLYGGETQLMGLRSIELGEEARGREMLRLLLQAHIDGRGRGDVGPVIEVFRADPLRAVPLYRQKRPRGRNIVTIFGKVRVERARYANRRGASVYPLDEALQLPAQSYSYEVQRRVVKKAVQGPFDEAVAFIQENTGVRFFKRSAEDIVVHASADFDSFYAQRTGGQGEESGPILVGSVDCKGIPMVKPQPAEKEVRRGKGKKANKKKMATVAAVFTQQPRVRTPEEVIKSLFEPERDRSKEPKRPRQGPERKRVWASLLAGKDAFIEDVRKEMDRRDSREAKLRVVLTDGERALQIRVCKTMKDILLVLDFLHVLEKLWAAAYVFHKEGSKEAVAFVRERALRILRGQVSQVIKGLRQMVTKRRLRGEKRKTLLATAGYYSRNRTRMRYNEYLAKGLPIASGSVEGACKNLIKDRMERSGMRWGPPMAEAMVKMRAVYLSGDFEEYWNYHIGQEQERLHPKGAWRATGDVAKK